MRSQTRVPAAPGWRNVVPLIFGGILITGAAGCALFRTAAYRPASPTTVPPPQVPVTVTGTVLAQPPNCEGRFIAHTLSFATGIRIREIGTYLSNGSGMAVNDLDGDGDLDLVFAGIDRDSAILWNQSGLKFEEESLDDPLTRGVNIVDVNGDGALDILFTHTSQDTISYWRNLASGSPRFVLEPLPGVTAYAYTTAWADLNSDGALDLVTASYNTELKQRDVSQAELARDAGVVVYTHQDGQFVAHRLTPDAEALSIGLLDLNDDGQLDIWTANDFLLPDQIWFRDGSAWQPAQPFAQTSYSTMSLEWGDLTNDGTTELFTTDMNPYDISPRTVAAWLPMISALEQRHDPDDPQVMANVLQRRDPNGQWRNGALQGGVQSTGWSWAGKFGDLDRDSFLDLYVVNGMIAADLFGHLPNAELVETNQAFHNRNNGTFELRPDWDLASTASGRGMVMADLDGDGDLDIVVNNLRSSAQLFENRVCGGSSLLVDLRWPGSPNTHAVGAQLELHTHQGVLHRDVRASSGYLSGDPARVSFGFPADAELLALQIRWPDGAVSKITDLKHQTHLEIRR
jgi:enediyne biosynthesis protein E4